MATTKKYASLSHSLILWFLLLALLPLTFVSWFSYQQANKNLIQAAEEKLEQSAALSVRFILNWFDYRLMDLNTQAESQDNVALLIQLSEGLQNSGKSSVEYVKSYDWNKRVDGAQNDLITLSRRYDYIYDLFLIDSQGNILYSVANESDLGTNLLNGPYAHTQFAQAVKVTQETGQTTFSGLERYAPSNYMTAGFISAPLLDEWGGKLGVFAIQLRFDRIFNLLNSSTVNQSTLKHYLLGEDGRPRSPVTGNNWDEVLERVIDTEQYKNFRDEHVEHEEPHHKEDTFEYIGPEGESVIGLHKPVTLANIKWLLISEINSDEALASAKWLGQITLALVLLTTLIVIIVAFYLARRITRPIIQLADASMKVAAGEIDHQVEIDARNEIGQLAESFNHMLQMRQMYEQVLQQSNEQAQQALEDLAAQKFALDQHAIVAVTNVQGTITFANDKFSEISGYHCDELVGQNHRILNSGYHDTQFFRDMYQTIANGEVWHGEVRNKAKDGHLYWVDTTIVPFMGHDGKPQSYIAIRADITKRKQTEVALIEAKEVAENAVQVKGEFLASMSHEIRTPMNGVLGMLGLLLNSKLEADQRHRATLAQSSAQSLLTLINDILDFSKVEAGKLELEILDFNLRNMLGEFTEAMALQAQEKGLELVLDIMGVEQPMVKGDPGRLRQIFTNLISNAIKFTSQGEIVIRVELHPYKEQQLRMHCTVSDSGIGIPVDKQDQLFDSFSQVDASTTRKYGGTGLGLAICKKLCELMDGDISVHSEPGKGSCFEVNLLLEKSNQLQQIIPQVDMQALNLLIVDDNATNREVLRGQLEHWGAMVVDAKNGEEAIAVCEKRIQQTDTPFFDIAFLDMQMPGMDGAELGKVLKADPRYSAMKLVIMTSIGDHSDARYFAEMGFSAYFPKPATTSDLFDALAVVTEGGDALQQARPLVTHHYLKTLVHNKNESATRYRSKDWSANTRLLLVEDNQMNQLVATGILNEYDLQADIAGNGLEALNSLQQAPQEAPYTLVLMDCQMPEMDGYEASRQIRAGKAGERYKTIPIIAMTANAMVGDREKCLDAGMSDYLSKPIDPDVFLAKLRQWLPDGQDQHPDKYLSKNSETNTIEPELTVWDKKAVLQRAMGKKDLLNTLIDIFFTQMPERMAKLQLAIDSGNTEQVHFLTHTIKGMAANISGLQLQQQADLMESAAKEGNKDKLAELMPDMKQASEQLMQCFEKYKSEQTCSSSSYAEFKTKTT